MSHTIEIHSAKNIPSERSLELVRWFDKEFGKIPFQWAGPDWYVLALSDDKLSGRVAIVERKVSVNGGLIEIAGISGVITATECRGQGVGNTMLRSAAEFIQTQLKINYGLLLCRSQVAPFYEQLGWKIIDGPTTFDQPSGKTVFPRLTMVLELDEKPWPDGPVDLCGLPW
jgi:hypothetical protein